MSEGKTENKSQIAQNEEKIIQFWKDNKIFEKSVEKHAPKGEFVFYEGPPTANGKPGIHHVESRSFKDIIPRFKTMQGFHVRRKGGWDTHGLPVEIQVEKELGLKSKKEVEEYGIAEFNKKCKESVWYYTNEWEEFTNRIAYWVDLENAYITYETNYIESIWNIIKKVWDDSLLYKDYKVIPWCPRCETALSSHELAQGYKDVKDLSVYAKFKVKGQEKTSLLAWTTTPWTLPGNVALAVGKDIDYVLVESEDELFILGKDRLSVFKEREYKIIEEYKGEKLIGLEYEPLYPFIKDNFPYYNIKKAFKVYEADFVTIEDGTGIVHTAVMYGQDDFELGNQIGLPKFHLVNENGTFKDFAGFLSGKFVKDEQTDVEIIKDLAHRGLLFHKEKYEHSYPHCWRCKTPLIYFARDSWFIRMSEIKDKLISENQKINWEPSHIKDGRFGEWLKDLKDWAISRSRFWGTPLPIWECQSCDKRKVLGSIDDFSKDLKGNNRYLIVRHGEAESNANNIVSAKADNPHHLTEKGKEEVMSLVKDLEHEKIDLVFSSDFIRTRETTEILAKGLNLDQKIISFDKRIEEINTGDFNLKSINDYRAYFSNTLEKLTKTPPNGENLMDVKRRVGVFFNELEEKYKGKTILIVSHEYPIWMMESAAKGWDNKESASVKEHYDDYIKTGKHKEIDFKPIPRNDDFELDLHRPYIDEVIIPCECGGEMQRVKEVMDVWFDSGAMPFAQDHYPFENKEWVDGEGYPADYISEAIDQTRGWFYTLHAVGNLMGKGLAYKNVICLGHLLDKEGKKMSKSLGNIVEPFEMINKYGADSLRFWMYTVNQPGESKNFDEKTVDEIVKKVLNPLTNILTFYKLFGGGTNVVKKEKPQSENILDVWILSYLSKLTNEVTTNLLNYKVLEAGRSFKDFISDLSQWYIRRSRDRFKEGDKAGVETLGFVLCELSKLLAPFMPFFAESLYQDLDIENKKESVHLEDWPSDSAQDKPQSGNILEEMGKVRGVVSLALEKRAASNIKVRQPLASLKFSISDFQSSENADSFLELIKEEVNVKNAVFDKNISGEVELDTNITSELKREGDQREFLRQVQALRKEANLTPDQEVILKIQTDERGKSFVKDFEKEVLKVANAKLSFEDVSQGIEMEIDDMKFSLEI